MQVNSPETSENRLEDRLFSVVALEQQQGAALDQIVARSLQHLEAFESPEHFISTLDVVLRKLDIVLPPEQFSALVEQVNQYFEVYEASVLDQKIEQTATKMIQALAISSPSPELVAVVARLRLENPSMPLDQVAYIAVAALAQAERAHADKLFAEGMDQPLVRELIEKSLSR